ncbi:hypothetical protein FNV43_RR10977 [Rhamnella rubrinervis]|uniref:Uncharacterized protein n=1 Tax=Rhamnella rubrinervis TaxID=2594499 RepID=A0A8K0H5D8_9ROSA|nr:hypothetical protein FNV43_RR10977 [Rhamnella rubrinervis]
MKFIVRSSYKLDPIEIEDDEDVQCFFKEYFRVDIVHTSPLFIEIEAKEDMPRVGEQDNAFAIPFFSRSGSNRLSSSRHKVVVNRSGIRGNEADEIPQNEGEENNVVEWSAINFHDGAEEPTIDDYNKLYNIPELDVEYNNDTYGERHEYEDEDIRLDEDETMYNEAGGDGNELNATLPVQVTNADIPFVPMIGSPIAPISNNNRGRHHSVRNESLLLLAHFLSSYKGPAGWQKRPANIQDGMEDLPVCRMAGTTCQYASLLTLAHFLSSYKGPTGWQGRPAIMKVL